MTYSLAGFVRFARQLRVAGEPLRLEAFERRMLADYFAGATETVIIIPKKNGKTTLLAALALYHLVTIPNAEVVIGASSRDQATIIFDQASSLLTGSPIAHLFDIRAGYRIVRLAGQKQGARIRVLAGDADTADGVIPTLALVDELHRHRDGNLYGVFRNGLGPRDGRMVTISTAGARRDSPLGQLRQRALELPDVVRDERRKTTVARSPNGAFVLHEWSLADTDDVADIRLVKRANPASWQTVAKLRERYDSPAETPWDWRRFACGIWTEGDRPWIAPATWDALADPTLELVAGERVVIAVDAGTREASGIVAVSVREDTVVCSARILTSLNDRLPLHRTEQAVLELAEALDVTAVVFDPVPFSRSAELLAARGLPMMEFPQTAERMSRASATLYELVDEGRLRHDGDPALRAHVLAGEATETERGWRLRKDPVRHPTNGLIALAMAAHHATQTYAEVVPLVGWA